MKKILSLVAVLALSMTAVAQNVKMSASVNTETKTVSICMDNDFEVTVLGFKFSLPEGVTLGTVYDEDEEEDVPAIIKNSDRCKSKHTVDIRTTPKGDYSVNIYGTNFKGTEGEVVSMKLEGEMTGSIQFYSVNFSDAAAKSYLQDDFTLDLSGTGINGIEAADSENAPIYNLAGQKVSKAVKGVYIQNGKKYMVK